jgi:hypothetical protein
MIEVVETAACEVSPRPASIPHNLPTIPRESRGQWFLSAISTDTEFVFINSTRIEKVVRFAEDGWTLASAFEFSELLNRQ